MLDVLLVTAASGGVAALNMRGRFQAQLSGETEDEVRECHCKNSHGHSTVMARRRFED